MQATEGMDVKEECQRWFMEMKWKKVHRFVVFKIDERSRAVLVDKVGGPGEGYEELVAALPGDDCRYAVYDYDFTVEDATATGEAPRSKIFFVSWSPEAAGVRSKMVYASSREGFRKELDGVQVDLQATEPSELTLDVLNDHAS